MSSGLNISLTDDGYGPMCHWRVEDIFVEIELQRLLNHEVSVQCLRDIASL